MSSLPRRSFARRKVAAVAVATVALGGVATVFSQSAASAHETYATLSMDCALSGAHILDIDVDYTVNHEPEDGATAGKPFTLITKSAVHLPPDAPSLPLKNMVITIPVPFGVSGGGDITATGGNLTKAGQTNGASESTITLNPVDNVTTDKVDVPQLTIPLTIAEQVPATIVFEGPSKLVIGIKDSPLTVECSAKPGNPPLLSLKPKGGTIVVAPSTTKMPTTTVKGASEGGVVVVKAKPQFTG